MSALTLRKNY